MEKLEKFGGQTPLGRPGQPAELASIYVQLAAADASYATGQVYGAAGGSGPAVDVMYRRHWKIRVLSGGGATPAKPYCRRHRRSGELPDLSTASPTGRPRDFSSGLRKPVTTSCACAVRMAVGERHEHDLVAVELRPVPAAMLADERAAPIGRRQARRRCRKPDQAARHASSAHNRAESPWRPDPGVAAAPADRRSGRNSCRASHRRRRPSPRSDNRARGWARSRRAR